MVTTRQSPALIMSATSTNYKCSIFTDEYGVLALTSRPYPNIDIPSVNSLSLLLSSSMETSGVDCSDSTQGKRYRKDGAGAFQGGKFPGFREVSLFESKVLSRSRGRRGHIQVTSPEDTDDVIEFCDNDGNKNTMSITNAQKKLLNCASYLKGIKERLEDASLGISSRYKNEGDEEGTMERFLRRCDAVVEEFLTALMQYSNRNDSIDRISQNYNSRKRRRPTNYEHDNNMKDFVNVLSLPVSYYSALAKQMEQSDDLILSFTTNDKKMINLQDASLTADPPISTTIEISDNLMVITLQHQDIRGRAHKLIAELNSNFPQNCPVWTCDLPIEFEPEWKMFEDDTAHSHQIVGYNDNTVDQIHKKNNTSELKTGLAAVFHGYLCLITTYQDLWDELDDIDENTCVLEPSLPAPRSSCERKLALREGGRLSIHIVLDNEYPRSIPVSLRMEGSAHDIVDLRSTYQSFVSADNSNTYDNGSVCEKRYTINRDGNENCDEKNTSPHCWSKDRSVRSNLETCFGFPLPSPATTEKSDFITECGICYAHHLPILESSSTIEAFNRTDANNPSWNTQKMTIVPNAMCSNPSCQRNYHESCLFEWLSSLSTARVSFDRIFGTCPYCCESISVKVK